MFQFEQHIRHEIDFPLLCRQLLHSLGSPFPRAPKFVLDNSKPICISLGTLMSICIYSVVRIHVPLLLRKTQLGADHEKQSRLVRSDLWWHVARETNFRILC